MEGGWWVEVAFCGVRVCVCITSKMFSIFVLFTDLRNRWVFRRFFFFTSLLFSTDFSPVTNIHFGGMAEALADLIKFKLKCIIPKFAEQIDGKQ